jgi:hypothetical protein
VNPGGSLPRRVVGVHRGPAGDWSSRAGSHGPADPRMGVVRTLEVCQWAPELAQCPLSGQWPQFADIEFSPRRVPRSRIRACCRAPDPRPPHSSHASGHRVPPGVRALRDLARSPT